MLLDRAITGRIYELCKERNITINKLSTLAGMPAGSLRSVIYGKSKNVGTRTILEICQALEITLYDFFDDEKFKSIELEGRY